MSLCYFTKCFLIKLLANENINNKMEYLWLDLNESLIFVNIFQFIFPGKKSAKTKVGPEFSGNVQLFSCSALQFVAAALLEASWCCS